MRSFVTIFVLIMAILPCRAAGAGKMAGETTASEPVSDSVAHPSQPDGWAPPAYDAAGGTPLGGSTSPAPRAEVFRPSKLIVPGVLFTAGVVGVNWDWYATNINIPLKDYAGELRSEWGYTKAENWIQYAPLAAYMGLGACGVGDHSFLEHFFTAGTAWTVEAVLVNGLKYTLCEMRPNLSARNSFPSGHTATAFLGAELVRLEYGAWAGAGAYTVATLTAVMRVYNNWHWFNDLLGGAAIGIVSANIGYWLLPLERRLLGEWFGWNIARGADSSRDPEVAIVPFAAPVAGLASAPVVGLVPAPARAQSVSAPTALGLSVSCSF